MCLFPKQNNNYKTESYRKGLHEFECGKCPECLAKRSSTWALRAIMQAKESKKCCMITLTYDTFKYDDKGNIIGENLNLRNVDKRDCQLFIKRLREYFDRKKGVTDIKYILSAEYGKRTGRPHYHALLFGVEFDDCILHKESKRGNKIYRSKTLEKLWKNGICTVDSQNLNVAIAKYCTKYCMKDFGIDDTFMLCSHSIGLNKLLENFNGLSYWIDGQEYPIPKMVWQKYIAKKYNFDRKSFKYIHPIQGEVLHASPTFSYVNRPRYEDWKGIQYNKYFESLKNPFLARKGRELYIDTYEEDKIFLANRKARKIARLYRDRDNEYQAYITYWKKKAESRIQLPVEQRISLLQDRKYHNFKLQARKWFNDHYWSGYSQWRKRPRFEEKWIPPRVICPYPSRPIRANDRTRKSNYVVFDKDNVVTTQVPKKIYKIAYKQLTMDYSM